MGEVIFEHISRDLELLITGDKGETQQGRITLTAIHRQDGDFILHGIGHASKQAHDFRLSQVKEIIDLTSGEKVNVAEFRAELMGHPIA